MEEAEHRREVGHMLDVVREIGERMGRAIAVQILGSGVEVADTAWPGLYPLATSCPQR
jgi:hypothetical protein